MRERWSMSKVVEEVSSDELMVVTGFLIIGIIVGLSGISEYFKYQELYDLISGLLLAIFCSGILIISIIAGVYS